MNTLVYTSSTQALYNEVVKHPSLFEELTPYQKECLLEFAQQQQEGATRTAIGLLNSHPQYDGYPEGCEGADRMEYWLLRTTAYAPSQQVLALFDLSPAPTLTSIKKGLKAEKHTTNMWAGLLLNSFTIEELDKLLLYIGMLSDTTSRRITDDAKPRTWVAVREALKDHDVLISDNKSAFASAIISRYFNIPSDKVDSTARRLKDAYNPENTDALNINRRACEYLKAWKSSL